MIYSMANDEYLPASLAAKEFSITADYVTKLARSELIRGRRDNGLWMIDPLSIREYLEEKRQGRQAWKERQAARRRSEQAAAGFESRAQRREQILSQYALPHIHVAPEGVQEHAAHFIASTQSPRYGVMRILVFTLVAMSFMYPISLYLPSALYMIHPSSLVAAMRAQRDIEILTRLFSREIVFSRREDL